MNRLECVPHSFLCILSFISIAGCSCTANRNADSLSDANGARICHVERVVASGEDHMAADLPHGSCTTSATECTLDTRDPCPDGSLGPLIDWTCTCQSGLWKCIEVGRSRTSCVGP
jgi:hypothetical protein